MTTQHYFVCELTSSQISRKEASAILYNQLSHDSTVKVFPSSAQAFATKQTGNLDSVDQELHRSSYQLSSAKTVAGADSSAMQQVKTRGWS